MNIKLFLQSRADVAQNKQWHHVVAYENAMCQTRIHVRAGMSVRVCACLYE